MLSQDQGPRYIEFPLYPSSSDSEPCQWIKSQLVGLH